MASFDYRDTNFDPKAQIRLLTLSPCKYNSEHEKDNTIRLHASLTTFNWDEKPPYIALSYTWGDATDLKTIVVNGKELEVTVNLHEALLEMQTYGPIKIWADAICINQRVNHEKSEQVKRMTRIYKEAKFVFAWLGPAADDSHLAMAGIHSIGIQAIEAGMLELDRETMLKLWDPDPEGTLTHIRQPFLDLSEKIGLDFPQVAIKALCGRSYFTRTWIVQEFSLATNLVIACGKQRLDFPEFCAAILFSALHRILTIKRLSDTPAEVDPTAKDKLQIFINNCESNSPSYLVGSRNRYQKQRPGYRSSLLELLNLFSDTAKATNPKDRIYGLLGVAPDGPELEIEVNYDKEVNEVFEDAARALLKKDFTDVLSWCKFPKGQSDLPTWVPDFSAPLPEPLCSPKYRLPPWKPLFSPSGSSTIKISSDDAPGQLTISGVIIDKIDDIGTAWKREDSKMSATLLDISLDKFFAEITFALKQAQNRANPVSNDPKFWEEALWRIPCADQQREGFARRRAQVGARDGLLEIIARNAGEMSGYKDEVKKEAWMKYYMAMEYLYDTRPFISTKGYVGLAPEFAATGDFVCVIFGAIVPYVLRKVERGYELVGEAYVHGIMDGEAMDMGLKEEELCLV